MKTKRLLAFVISAAMAISTVSPIAFADEEKAAVLANEAVEDAVILSNEAGEEETSDILSNEAEETADIAAEEADEAAGFDNFKKVAEYADGTFIDVKLIDWFYNNVKSVFELGLMVGRSESEFAGDENMTVAEAMTIAARLNSIYKTGKDDFEEGEPWYKVYTDYCKENGIADIANYDPDALVTRGQFADIFANALPEEALKAINTIVDGEIPDVKESSAFGEAVYALYRAGILTGNDEYGTYAPNSNIKRTEVAAITDRIAVPASRKTVSLKKMSNGQMHTVSFDLNYDGEALESQSVKDGQYATVPAMPKRSGYTFTGWFTDKKLNSKYNFEKPVTEDITLYAHWSKSGGTVGTSISVPTNRTNTDTDTDVMTTIAEILATVPDFPVSTSWQKTADNSWTADGGAKCYRLKADDPTLGTLDELAFGFSCTDFTLNIAWPVEKSGNNYTASLGTIKINFTMADNKLVAISLSGCTDMHTDFNGKTFTAPTAESIKYMAWDGTNKKLVEKSTTEAIEVTSSTTTLDAGKFYIVKGADVTTGTLTVNGTASSPTTLILADGAKLTATGGINVVSEKSLVITGQSGGTGTLIAKGNDSSAGIGGDENNDGGTVTINGGNITANGGDSGAGIGGGDLFDGGTVTINGGTVTANGGKWGAGIGGGDESNGGTVTINGGIVTATGGDDAAAIGGGRDGEHGTLIFGEGVIFKIKAGSDKDSAQTKTTTEYGSDHSAKYVSIEELSDGYYLVGKLNGTDYWSADKLTAAMKLKENESVSGEYIIDWTFYDGDGVKVCKLESGTITVWYPNGMDNELKVTTASGNAGEGTLHFNPDGNEAWKDCRYFYIEPKN